MEDKKNYFFNNHRFVFILLALDFGHSLDNDGMAQMFKSKKDAGHVLHFGVANWNIDQFSKFEEALNKYGKAYFCERK